jgi:Flp pilus assembly protein TadG
MKEVRYEPPANTPPHDTHSSATNSVSQFSCAGRSLATDCQGAAIIEAAFVLPIVIALLFGVATFGQWFMIAHTMQQAADEASRAAVAGLNDDDRRAMVTQSVTQSLAVAGGVDPALVSSASKRSGEYYTVTVTYQTSQNKSLTMGIVPLPLDPIARHSTVKLVYE